jgi:hypothetical protein
MREPRDFEPSPPPARVFDVSRLCAGGLALLGWAALGIELDFTLSGALTKNEPLAPALVRFFSFFTIQTHLLLALMLTAACLRPGGGGFFLKPGVKAAAVTYVIIVGAVYAILLRHLYHLKGYMLIADRILHDFIPVAFPLYWLAFVPRGGVKWVDPFVWLIFPTLYFLYTLARGALAGAYPYPFFDVEKLGLGQVVLNALGLLAVILALGFCVAAIDHARAARKSRGRRALGSAADF